jgi:putative SOS response-associated peptidase YedK
MGVRVANGLVHRWHEVILMCGAICRLFHTSTPSLPPTWNMVPTQDAMVVRHHPKTVERHLDLLKWGLLPYFTKDPARAKRPINARAEIVQTSGMFKAAFARRRRCIVPADAFYEWKVIEGGKQPYAIARQDGQPMAFAGLWEGLKWPDGTVTRSFAIITTDANKAIAQLHDRMPVILEPEDWPTWLGKEESDPAVLFRPSGEDVLKVWPVSKMVNSPKNNGAALLEAVGKDDQPCQPALRKPSSRRS